MPLSWVRAFWQFFLFVIFNWEIITIDISTHYIQCEKNTVIVHVYGLFILFRSLCINRKSVNHMKMLVNGFVRILGLLINLNLLKACFFVFFFSWGRSEDDLGYLNTLLLEFLIERNYGREFQEKELWRR